jgi:ABC-type sulfate transport system permease component
MKTLLTLVLHRDTAPGKSILDTMARIASALPASTD